MWLFAVTPITIGKSLRGIQAKKRVFPGKKKLYFHFTKKMALFLMDQKMCGRGLTSHWFCL
jgi:hypothetical protein